MRVAAQLGRRIRQLRQSNGWTQQKLATLAGLQRTHITRIECGDFNPQLDTLEQIVDALEVSFAVLFAEITTTNQQIKSKRKNGFG